MAESVVAELRQEVGFCQKQMAKYTDNINKAEAHDVPETTVGEWKWHRGYYGRRLRTALWELWKRGELQLRA